MIAFETVTTLIPSRTGKNIKGGDNTGYTSLISRHDKVPRLILSREHWLNV